MVQYVPPTQRPDTVLGSLDTAGLDTFPLDTSGALEPESLLISESAQVTPSVPSPDTGFSPLDTSGLDTSLLQVESLLIQESLPTAPPTGTQ